METPTNNKPVLEDLEHLPVRQWDWKNAKPGQYVIYHPGDMYNPRLDYPDNNMDYGIVIKVDTDEHRTRAHIRFFGYPDDSQWWPCDEDACRGILFTIDNDAQE